MTIKFTDAAKFYEETSEQKASWEWLQNNVSDEVYFPTPPTPPIPAMSI